MKARIPTAAISRTLQAVATLGGVSPSAMSETTSPTILVDPSRATEGAEIFSSILGELSQEQEVSSFVNFPVAAEWDHKSDRRFVELADREARGIATMQELEELEHLSEVRRRHEASRSGEEVLREYEQHQLIRNLLQSLTRYVEFVRTATPEPSSAGYGAKAKA